VSNDGRKPSNAPKTRKTISPKWCNIQFAVSSTKLTFPLTLNGNVDRVLWHVGGIEMLREFSSCQAIKGSTSLALPMNSLLGHCSSIDNSVGNKSGEINLVPIMPAIQKIAFSDPVRIQ